VRANATRPAGVSSAPAALTLVSPPDYTGKVLLYGGRSSIGGAPDCGSGGCGFKSRRSPQPPKSALSADRFSPQGTRLSGPIAAGNLPKTPESGGLWRSFESSRDLQIHIGDTVLANSICSSWLPEVWLVFILPQQAATGCLEVQCRAMLPRPEPPPTPVRLLL
jgi:hypothetical protein